MTDDAQLDRDLMTVRLLGELQDAYDGLLRWVADRDGSRFGTVTPMYTNCPPLQTLIETVGKLLSATA